MPSTPSNAGIRYWDRFAKKEETEKVYGEGGVRFLYGGNPLGKLTGSLLSAPLASRLYGHYQSSRWSMHKIEDFIRAFEIPMYEYENGPFRSFNEFFIRKFRYGARHFATDARALPAFAEARYLGFAETGLDVEYPVKGQYLTSAALLNDPKWAEVFAGGPLLIARLCPVDYHRYHYPTAGRTLASYPVRGALHSVNPWALARKGNILATNERRVAILETEGGFGRLAYIEVGALCVGKIVQTYPESVPFKRGDEKGYFLFGASTVVLLGERGKWRPSADILEHTGRRLETLVRLGDPVATLA